MTKIANLLCILYDSIKESWESKRMQKFASNVLVLSFALGILFYALFLFEIVDVQNEFFTHPFFAIEVSFTLLLIMELFSLIFALSESVAKSNIKQYELLSLIFLRSGFKEFSHIHNLSDWTLQSEPLINMFSYGVGGLLIFIVVNITYKLQKHVKLTADEDEQSTFIKFKKILSLLMIASFVIIGVTDIKSLIQTGTYAQSFETFYTILIFSDIMIVLFALRYSSKYIHIFRYSAFVLATIFIRISFSLKTHESILVGLGGALFVLLLTYSYNYFLRKPSLNLIKKD